MARVIVASTGFTVDFAVRRVADLGREEVKYLMAVALQTEDEVSWRRVEEAYGLLSHYLSGLGIPSELRAIRKGYNMVRELKDCLARANSLAGVDGLVEVYVTGGPRILVLGLVVASLLSTPEVRDRIIIVAYGETFEGSLEIPAGAIARLLGLDEPSYAIISTLSRLGGARAEELRRILGMKRSTIYKKLRELSDMGLVNSSSGIWRVHESLEQII